VIDLRLGDCLEVMKTLPDNSVDLVITSPPYDKLRDYKGFTFNFEGIAEELFRIIKQGGVVVWVVGDQVINGSESGTSFRQALYFKELGFNLHDTMIYKKTGCPFPEINRYYPIFEYMFILSKGKPKTTNLIKDRINKYAGAKVARRNHARQVDGTVKENSAFRNEPNRLLKDIGVRFNIWEITSSRNVNVGSGNHPAIFPEALANDHILSWSNEGDLVLDPMMGSGTVGKMAKLNKRNFIGIEISPEYFKIAERRINNTTENLL
jgi:site-specific DNA-methyltransferase (adenine-specific)